MTCQEKTIRATLTEAWGIPVVRVRITLRDGRFRARVSLPEGVKVNQDAGVIRRGVLHVNLG